MVTLVSKDWKPLEQIIREKKIQEISLEMVERSEDGVVFNVKGDGKILHVVHTTMQVPDEFFKLKLSKSKKGFPLELSSIEVNLGVVKAKFDKKSR